MKKYLKPCAYNPSEPSLRGVMVPLKNEPAESGTCHEVNRARGAMAKASPNGAIPSRVWCDGVFWTRSEVRSTHGQGGSAVKTGEDRTHLG